ncbi:hypothetical protein [Hylemonella gracilis]|nr:hypothetical protein [Hylemonella gracilis]
MKQEASMAGMARAAKNLSPGGRAWPLPFMALAASLLMGCATPSSMNIAMTELGTVSKSEFGAYGLRMQRVVNITGTGAEDVVGMVSYDPDPFSVFEHVARFFPGHKDLPDAMAPRFAPGAQTQVLERHFCKTDSQKKNCELQNGNVTLSNLIELRDVLQVSQAQAALAAQLQVRKIVLEEAKSMAAKSDRKDSVLKSLSQLYKGEDFSADGAIDKAIDATKQAVETSGLNLAESLRKVREKTSKSGIFVTQWTSEVDASGSMSAGQGASASASSRRQINGFLILGDPRVINLLLGTDLGERRGKSWKELGLPPNDDLMRRYITYYQLRARFVVYAESRESEIKAALEADLKQVIEMFGVGFLGSGFSAAALSDLNVKVNAIYAQVGKSLGSGVLDANEGFLAEPRACPLHQKEGWNQCMNNERKKAEGTVPIVSIRGTLDNYMDPPWWKFWD